MCPRVTVLACGILLAALVPVNGAAPAPAEKIKELQKEHLAVVTRIAELAIQKYKAGALTFDQMVQAQTALLTAKLDLAETNQERIKAYEEMVTLAEQALDFAEKRLQVGGATQLDALTAKAQLL